MRRFGLRLALGAFLIMLPAAPAAAQDTGIVTGTVVDASGQVLPGATVALTNEATRDARTMVRLFIAQGYLSDDKMTDVLRSAGTIFTVGD